MEKLFWLAAVAVAYPYLLYPLALRILSLLSPADQGPPLSLPPPLVSMIVPVHNEAARIPRKIANTASLSYPAGQLEVLYVSDGSTDATASLIRSSASPPVQLVELPTRAGKAAALNAGLERAAHDIVVFSDAAIELEPWALEKIVRQFADPRVGCVSGEDRIADAGGEALYGRFELYLRRLESRTGSVAGASGSFYAQRRSLCGPFVAGMAPDFLSVLRTVERGYRAVSEPEAAGTMTSVRDPGDEFDRKVRTLLRGITTLFAHAHLLNPLRFGVFAFTLWSHKVMRWFAPFFLLLLLLSSLTLASSPWYLAAFVVQVGFYGLAAVAASDRLGLRRSLAGKVALYFTTAHLAILLAWYRYASGVRQEIWAPSRR